MQTLVDSGPPAAPHNMLAAATKMSPPHCNQKEGVARLHPGSYCEDAGIGKVEEDSPTLALGIEVAYTPNPS